MSDEDLRSATAEQDRRDLENERMGLENTGRVKRFLLDSHGTNSEEAKRQRRRDIDATLLEIMLRNREYAERYQRVIDKLTEAERTVEIALAKAEAALARLENELADMEAAAAKDPDGRAVFYDAEGRARYADGSAVDDVTAATILPRDGASSYETWQATQDAAAETEAAIGDLEDIRDNVLAPIRVEVEDEDNPPTTERLEEIEDAVDAAAKATAKVETVIEREAPSIDVAKDSAPPTALPDLEALLPG